MALTGVFILCAIVFGLACYIYMSLALQTIAVKTNTENPWLAWNSDRQHYFDVNGGQETAVVASPVFHSPRESCYGDNRLDGRRRSSWEAELVGHHDDRSIRWADCPRLSSLGRLMIGNKSGCPVSRVFLRDAGFHRKNRHSVW
jgi:hypothetical protein